MIEISELTKVFGTFTAVDRLSLQVDAGEVLGFLGPTGAGKSTTMKMVTGFLSPTAGSAKVCGHDIVEDTLAAQREIGYLPEGAPLYGDKTVRQFLTFIARIRGFDGAEAGRRVLDSIERLELQSVYNQTIETLSKGFKRRVGLAQAILHDPRVLILDEPTDGLDPNQKQQVRDLIRHLSKDKIVVISTPILEEVAAVCSRAVIISSGRIVADGTPADLEARSRYHQAVTLEVASEISLDGLRRVPGVSEIEVSAEGRLITVFPANGQAIFPAVQEVIRDQGWQVESLHVERGRLDEVFRSITAEAPR